MSGPNKNREQNTQKAIWNRNGMVKASSLDCR